MKWDEVKEKYPNSFVKFKAIKSHMINNEKIVDELEIIKVFNNGYDAMKEFSNNKKDQYIYSTTQNIVSIKVNK